MEPAMEGMLDDVNQALAFAKEEHQRKLREDTRPKRERVEEAFAEALEGGQEDGGLETPYQDLEDDGVAMLADWLKGKAPGLLLLDLGGNRISNGRAVADVLKLTPKLVDLDLRDNPLRPDGVHALQEALHGLKQLRILSLNECQIGDYGAEVIANLCQLNANLDTVSLVNNRLTSKAAEHFSSVLSRPSCAVTTLHLDYNRLGCDGAEILGKALIPNQRLTTLGLSDNNIECAGAVRMCEHLSRRKKHALKRLDLSVNKLSDGGYRALGAWLAGETGLISLDVGGQTPPCGDSAVLEIASRLPENNTLRQLDLTNSDLTDEAFAQLEGYLERNDSLCDLPIEVNEQMSFENRSRLRSIVMSNRGKGRPKAPEAEAPPSPAGETPARQPPVLAAALAAFCLLLLYWLLG